MPIPKLADVIRLPPLPMGRAIARAVKEATELRTQAADAAGG